MLAARMRLQPEHRKFPGGRLAAAAIQSKSALDPILSGSVRPIKTDAVLYSNNACFILPQPRFDNAMGLTRMPMDNAQIFFLDRSGFPHFTNLAGYLPR